MKRSLNKIRNASFSEGKSVPRGWTWKTTMKDARWQRGSGSTDGGGMRIITKRASGTAWWSQVIVCKPGEFYRVEADVRCVLSVSKSRRNEDDPGLVLAVQPSRNGRRSGVEHATPGLRRASSRVTVRAYYRAPEDVRRLEVSVGVLNARGTATIDHVGLFEILEPETISHILAIPPPPYTLPAPRVARSVCVCSARAHDRPATRLLSAYFGQSSVQAVSPESLRPQSVKSDAMLLPDADPPPSIRSINALMKLATKQIVVISLPAFSQLTDGQLSLRRIEQEDDPIYAKVAYANYATRGFALHDQFPYAWSGRLPGAFAQNQYRKTDAFKEFCERHGLVTLLMSMCNRDVTSDRPICLDEEVRGGGLFVLDIEPVETDSSTLDEPTLAMYLLLSILGQTQNSLGQYVVPVREEAEFRESVREMAMRSEHFVVHDANVPVDEVEEQLVTIGREDQTFGLALSPKPAILVRSGMTSGDVAAVYGAFVWFKQLVRMTPHECAYAQALASQFRLAWIPLAAAWEACDGWRASRQPPGKEMAVEVEDSATAVLIDIVSHPRNRARVTLPRADTGFRHYATWLPRLLTAFGPGRYFAPTADDGESSADRDGVSWRRVSSDLEVAVDSKCFDADAHRDVLAAGGQVVRIEIPGGDSGFCAHSIHLTDLAATLLEHVIGLQYGLIAVNRQPTPVQLDGFPPVGPGDALIIDRRDPMLRANMSQAS